MKFTFLIILIKLVSLNDTHINPIILIKIYISRWFQVNGVRCGSGVRTRGSLVLTPQGEFGDLMILQGFKSRDETLARPGPHSVTPFT